MASLQKKYTREKLIGQIFTPDFIVEKILNDIGFNDESCIGRTVLDPACGDGRFLIRVAKRIIRWSAKKDLKKNLEKIYGWDIDEKAVADCLENLNKLVAPFSNLFSINWNVSVNDALKFINKKDNPKFDFIVGNPPYIRVQHLELEQRQFVQSNFSFCKKGSTDIYIAFFELAFSLLNDDGICSFITPNTFFYTETGSDLRQFLAEKNAIRQITNFGDLQVFENATTYSAITFFGKKPAPSFIFEKAETLSSFQKTELSINSLDSKTWRFNNNLTEKRTGRRLGDLVNIHVGVTTLADRFFIFKIIKENAESFNLESKAGQIAEIEKAILRPIIKVSTLKNAAEKPSEFILFPYKTENGKPKIIEEDELFGNYPKTYFYLKIIEEELNKRDAGKPNSVAWYAFGRSQGLTTSFGRKILFSPMNRRPNFLLSTDETATFYSGYCIKCDREMENALLQQLNSARMADFIAASSRDFRGGWKAYNKHVVEDFWIETDDEGRPI